MQIAVTSQNRKTITEHAGKCRKFWIYDVEKGVLTGKRLVELSIDQSLHASAGQLAEPLAGTRGAESMGDAYFGFYLMAMGKGRPRTRTELEGMLKEAGVSQVSEIASPIPLQTRILSANA